MQSVSEEQKATRVLVVDDDPGLLRGYARLLREAGHDVITADRAETALAMLAGSHVGLVLCDISLPDTNGVTLLRQLREQQRDLPVVLMTGAPAIDTAIKAVEYGAFRYLTKPIEAPALRDVVDTGLRLHKLAELQRQASALRETKSDPRSMSSLAQRFEDALMQLWMAYQPIVDVPKRTTLAYEALVRTNSASMTNPGEMFDAAEKLGRVFDIGRMIRRRVAADAGTLPAGALLFVNLHPSDLLDEDLYASDSSLSKIASRVILEITERAPLDSIPDLKSRVQKLIRLGYRLAIDDLGAGYSGLASFTQLEPHVVKFDMALTRDIHKSETKQKLVRSMLSLCDDLSIKTVAEGVETVEERDMLLQLGCSTQQGYLFAKPAKPFAEAKIA